MIQVSFRLVCDAGCGADFTAGKIKDQVELLILARDKGWGYKGGHKPTWFCPACTRAIKARGERLTFDNDQYEED